MKTLLEIVNLSTQYLQDKGIANARRQAQDLICDALGIDRITLYMEHDRPLSEAELTLLRQRLTRRAQGEPNPYIHGEVYFGDCVFQVKRDTVLIPRQETEILWEKIVNTLEKETDLQNKVLWDVCCGSGCLGIALKKHFPALTVVLADICPKALAIASHNAILNGVEIECVEGDLLAPLAGRRADFFVCNPPYISEGEYEKLDREVKDFEPQKALVGGVTGLEFYQRLASDLARHLTPSAKAWFELGTGQGQAVSALFASAPWKARNVEVDWSGHDRFFFLEIE
jgi:release factor glutamine methyltransferase